MIYVCIMFKKESILKQFIAGCLLLVFVSIHWSKLLHVHDHDKLLNKHSTCSTVLEKKASCAVCEYHLITEECINGDIVPKPAVAYYTPSFCFRSVQTVSSVGLSYADRGPPHS